MRVEIWVGLMAMLGSVTLPAALATDVRVGDVSLQQSAPQQLRVNGALRVVGGVETGVRVVSTNVTLDKQWSTVLCSPPAQGLTITLPRSQDAQGRSYLIKRIGGAQGAAAVSINPVGSDTIDGSEVYLLESSRDAVALIGVPGGWIVAGRVMSAYPQSWRVDGKAGLGDI